MSFPAKSPSDVLDYAVDFADFLADDTITNAVITVSPSDMTVSNITWTGTNVSFWLSAGDLDVRYTVSVTITTNGGRTATRSEKLDVAAL